MNPEIDTFDCQITLPGWRLHIAELAANTERDLGNVMELAARGMRTHLRREHPAGRLDQAPLIGAIRDSLRDLGHDPLKIPPCSEQLLTRFLASGDIPRGCLAWDFLAMLTVKSHAPWCILSRASLEPPLVYRLGEAGEKLPHGDGEFEVASLPVLADQNGVVASPWTVGEPHALEGAAQVVFTCFLPRDLFRVVQPKSHLGRAIWLTWAYRFVFERTCSHPED